MTKEPKWYAVYTKPRWEKKVAKLLAGKGVEHYCPVNKVLRQWSDRRKIVEEPLFNLYVFVRVNEADLLKVKQTDGVVRLLYWLGKPAVIRDHEIEAIKEFLNCHSSVKLMTTEVKVDDVVKITHGPLISKQGNVIAITNHYVKLQLPTLGCALVAQVHKSHVEKVTLPASKEALA